VKGEVGFVSQQGFGTPLEYSHLLNFGVLHYGFLFASLILLVPDYRFNALWGCLLLSLRATK
jgi:hypothetical protein